MGHATLLPGLADDHRKKVGDASGGKPEMYRKAAQYHVSE